MFLFVKVEPNFLNSTFSLHKRPKFTKIENIRFSKVKTRNVQLMLLILLRKNARFYKLLKAILTVHLQLAIPASREERGLAIICRCIDVSASFKQHADGFCPT